MQLIQKRMRSEQTTASEHQGQIYKCSHCFTKQAATNLGALTFWRSIYGKKFQYAHNTYTRGISDVAKMHKT